MPGSPSPPVNSGWTSRAVSASGRTGARRSDVLVFHESRVCEAGWLGSWLGFGPAMIDGIGLSTRCRSSSATGGARADRAWVELSRACVYQRKRTRPVAGRPAMGGASGRVHAFRRHRERKRSGRAGLPLAREHSAGVGQRPAFGPQGSGEGGAATLPGVGSRRGGRGPNPARRFLPVQRELGASRRRPALGFGGFVVVLVNCSDCRSRRDTSRSASCLWQLAG